MIFLPCHRSHVDYVSLQLICYRLGLALPTVVAGENLNLPVVGSFLQHAGESKSTRSQPTFVHSYHFSWRYPRACMAEARRLEVLDLFL